VRNTGARAGSRTVLAIAEKLGGDAWAPRQLVAFTRTWLAPGSSERLRLSFDPSALQPGDYRLHVDGATQVIHVR
jgi:Fibronectin type III-like domain